MKTTEHQNWSQVIKNNHIQLTMIIAHMNYMLHTNHKNVNQKQIIFREDENLELIDFFVICGLVFYSDQALCIN